MFGDVKAYLGADWDRLQGEIARAVHSDIPLLDAVNSRILSHGGKMLRPTVTMLAAGACNGGRRTDRTFAYAAAAELLHNATLLHDDVADESDTRRGKPTLRASLGPAYAVLVGDFWLSRAVELVIGADSNKSVIDMFAGTLSDLAEGEMLQLQKAADVSTTQEDYFRIIHCKTSSLFITAALSGALSVGAAQQEQEAVKAYSQALGTAFQIRDDILDYVGDGSLGKPVGIDIREKKITLPLFLAMEGNPREREIRQAIAEMDTVPQHCEQIHKFVMENGGVEKAEAVLSSFVQDSLNALGELPESPDRDALAAIAQYNLGRTK